MIVNTPAIDYWRATTSQLSRMDDLASEIQVNGVSPKKWWFQQYSGNSWGGVAMGSALQHGKPSYIVDISGGDSDDLFPVLKFSDMKLTRIDLQFTMPKPIEWDTVEYHFICELEPWPKGIKRDVQTRLNAGNDTVYLGDRTSKRFTRVYVKEVNFIRFEMEYKKDMAVRVWQEIKKGDRRTIAGILLHEVLSLPICPFHVELARRLRQHVDAPIEIKSERVKATKQSKLKWLASLMPTIERMINDSDYGDTVAYWFDEILSRRQMSNLGEENEE